MGVQMDIKIIELDKFRVVGVSREINCENGNNHVEIPNMWDELNEDGTTEKIATLNDGQVEGLLGICFGKTETEIDYWIATSSNCESKFESIVIPSSKWAVFKVNIPVLDNIPDVWHYIFSDWFVSHEFEHGGAPDMEVYFQSGDGLECEIWVSIQ